MEMYKPNNRTINGIDALEDSSQTFWKIDKIEIKRNEIGKEVIITLENGDESNCCFLKQRLIAYENLSLTSVGDNFYITVMIYMNLIVPT